MLPTTCFFYLILISKLLAAPQINLDFTINEKEYNDANGSRYNCFRLASNMNYVNNTRHISTYCLSESSLKFHIDNDRSSQTFSFADLARLNITSEDLYIWSTPLDIIEQYQIYLETNDLSLSKQFFYNCTLPRFGSMCQYEFYYYHENYSSLYEMIRGYYKINSVIPDNLTCYMHLKCHRGYPPICLDWTEICDGKVDCLDGNADEEHCWQLEFNECQPNEYVCDIGQCIPNEFVRDDQHDFDCIDRSDEKAPNLKSLLQMNTYEPTFGSEDFRCEGEFLSRSCVIYRHTVMSELMFPVKDSSISSECWLAFQCYLAFPNRIHPGKQHDLRKCISTIKETCPDVLYVPNIPIFFGHVYTAYRTNRTEFVNDYTLPYLCSNKPFHFQSPNIVSGASIKNTTCFKIRRFTEEMPIYLFGWLSRYYMPLTNMYRQLEETNPIINFPVNRCNEANIYQCSNSSKCISFHRLMNSIFDCPYHDDENIYEDTNPEVFARLKHRYYKCHFTNRYVPYTAIENGKCDCGYIDDSFCEDESDYDTLIQTTISFSTTCDDVQDLRAIEIDGQNHTDETECQHWECDNIYTRCDRIWNCLDGRDEIGCNSLSTLFHCSSEHRICVRNDTLEFTCLPKNKLNDGEVDCLGGTDEPKLCEVDVKYSMRGGFYCVNNGTPTCLETVDLCNQKKDCSFGDDERFCLQNRSALPYDGLCRPSGQLVTSNVERFICYSTIRRKKLKLKHFTIKGFHETATEEENTNELLNEYKPISLLDNRRCLRGLDVRVWLNQPLNLYTSTCFCPPNYYGDQCQYQNQRVSLAIRFHVSTQLRHTQLAVLILLIDDTNQRIVHSYEQFTYLSIRDCNMKFNLYLLYSTRPKQLDRTYSIHIDIYEKVSLKYRGSFFYPVNFFFLPVHRLAFIVSIPLENNDQSCSNTECLHGKCWSGQYCHIPHHCTCSSNSICVGLSSYNRSICVCREKYFGSDCYIQNRICHRFQSENDGTCIPRDDFMLPSTKQKYFCICPKGFSGSRCQLVDTEINLIFDKEMQISQSIFIHFLRIIPYGQSAVIPKSSSERLTTLQTVSQATNSIRIYWSKPFHLTFIETLDKTYYLTVLQPIYNHSMTIIRRINSSHRCPSIGELVNETFAQLHVLRRMKLYHLICQQYSVNLQCFYDDLHLCLCYDYVERRLANCFRFDHHMKFDCYSQNDCENGGQCFQDSPDCPKRSICVCRSCYYGNRCQFSTSEFGLSLDAILAYHIIPNANIFHQTAIVKLSFSLTIMFMIVGFANGVLSLITFKNKIVLEVGCGIYLLGSSITTMLTTLFFGLKYFIYLSSQISPPTNRSFLRVECYSVDFLLRICLNMDQWLNACVAMERAMTAIQGVQFVKKKSKELAKKVIGVVLLFIILTSIHDPIHRELFEEEDNNDENKKRIWCIVNYSSNLQIYNRIINTFLFFVPFLINFISTIIVIAKKSHRQSHLRKHRSYKAMLCEQILDHQHLLVAPIVLCALALPRLILSYVTKSLSYNQPKFCSTVEWNADGHTFAFDKSTEERYPVLCIDTSNTIYIASEEKAEILLFFRNHTSFQSIRYPYQAKLSWIFVIINGDMYTSYEKWLASTNEFIRVIDTKSTCFDLFIDIENNLYCSMLHTNKVAKEIIGRNGNDTCIAGTNSVDFAPHQLNGPMGIFLDTNLDLYVADRFNGRIQLFHWNKINGKTVAGASSSGTTISLFHPYSVTLDSKKYLFIVERGNNCTVGSESNGFRCLLECDKEMNTMLYKTSKPTKMNLDVFGNLFVSDRDSSRIRTFDLQTDSCVHVSSTTQAGNSSVLKNDHPSFSRTLFYPPNYCYAATEVTVSKIDVYVLAANSIIDHYSHVYKDHFHRYNTPKKSNCMDWQML
ncbi:unnamed protein product [Adineta ricciae]|uniref:Uncharacterized protein n=1 Tax=Adineta ricciae TaxID=249248 RepID=A0A814BQL2_ADIRI|nr:unnamed protein product [Adineta ricciae]